MARVNCKIVGHSVCGLVRSMKRKGACVPGENSENEEGLFGNDGNEEGERGP